MTVLQREAARRTLLEPEAYGLVTRIGIAVPAHLFVRSAAEGAAADLDRLPSDRVVIKVISPEIPHRSEVGGVAIVPRDRSAVFDTLIEMQRRFPIEAVAGFLISQHIPHDPGIGGELLLGARWTSDFGPVVTLGPGGVYAEYLCENMIPGRDVAILSPSMSPTRVASVLEAKPICRLVTGRVRSQQALIGPGVLRRLVSRFLDMARDIMPAEITELEINPLALTPGGPVALDVLARTGDGRKPGTEPDRPLHKIRNLLEPRSIAIIGVSESMNPGHMILSNLIRDGFDRSAVHVVKPGREEIEGCRCYPDIASVPGRVDLFILGIDARQIPAAIQEVLTHRKAESLIAIPGGLGEREGTEDLADAVKEKLRKSRSGDWGGPVLNGGNCLGIRSVPGRYNTMFIPRHKLPAPRGDASPLAILSQSGAFAVARASKMPGLNPKYSISFGNQTDLTVGDYLTYLKDDPGIEVFACYVEGFRPMDGARWLQAAAEITASGRVVILYRGGRTSAGALASSTHTASIAGDYAVTRELARAEGVVVADTLEDFEDTVRLFCLLSGKAVAGRRLAATSNAGFECVAMADNLGRFRLARFGEPTRRRLEEIVERHRLGSIVTIGNPLDLTPIMADASFEDAVRAVMEDEEVDLGVIGCEPMTGALETLPASEHHGEDILHEGSIVSRLARLAGELAKPWVAVVDAGPLYDPMAAALEIRGVPTFRSADRALRLLETFCAIRMGD